jgi:hypothetical protein
MLTGTLQWGFNRPPPWKDQLIGGDQLALAADSTRNEAEGQEATYAVQQRKLYSIDLVGEREQSGRLIEAETHQHSASSTGSSMNTSQPEPRVAPPPSCRSRIRQTDPLGRP